MGLFRPLSAACRALGNLFLWVSAAGLVAMTAIVGYQVWGRYVLNETPIAAEPVSLLVMLYVSLLGAAIGVREGFHMSMVFVRDRTPEPWRTALDVTNHLLVGAFAAGMAWYGWKLAAATWSHVIPTVGISEGLNYLSIPLSGVATLLFVAEHLLAIATGGRVEFETFRDAVE